MPKTVNINIAIELTGDEFEEAAQMVALKPAYDQIVAALEAAGVKFTPSLGSGSKRTRPAAATANGKPRGRPRKQTGTVTVTPLPPADILDDLEPAA